jgi:hypothetical protein
MKARKTCIVVTTINAGGILDGYCKQAEDEGVRELVEIIVIPDLKTPKELFGQCEEVRKRGFKIECPTVEEQDEYLKKFGNLAQLVPYNSDNRRNIGYLMSLETDCEVMLSIDDDNYALGETYSTSGYVCEDAVSLPAVHSGNGWFNFCDLLEIDPGYKVFPRGFPYHKRTDTPELSYKEEAGRVRMNVGLWVDEPDLDAITWLAAPVRARAFKPHNGDSILLGQDTWSPINTQNTALHRNVTVTYYFVRMGYPLAGLPIDRYGDIFSGYLSQACVRHMGDRIRVGTPVADHKRNAHNYMRDLAGELACIMVLEPILEWLPTAKLQGSNYADTYLSLADAIEEQLVHFTGPIWNDATRGYFHQMAYCMRQWVKACRQIG